MTFDVLALSFEPHSGWQFTRKISLRTNVCFSTFWMSSIWCVIIAFRRSLINFCKCVFQSHEFQVGVRFQSLISYGVDGCCRVGVVVCVRVCVGNLREGPVLMFCVLARTGNMQQMAHGQSRCAGWHRWWMTDGCRKCDEHDVIPRQEPSTEKIGRLSCCLSLGWTCRLKIAGHEIDGPSDRAWKCNTWKCRTWKYRTWNCVNYGRNVE